MTARNVRTAAHSQPALTIARRIPSVQTHSHAAPHTPRHKLRICEAHQSLCVPPSFSRGHCQRAAHLSAEGEASRKSGRAERAQGTGDLDGNDFQTPGSPPGSHMTSALPARIACPRRPSPRLSAACRLLPIAYCLLPAACCLLPVACCLLPVAYCLLPVACCLLPAACCLLRAACCLLPIPCCLLPIAYSPLPFAPSHPPLAERFENV